MNFKEDKAVVEGGEKTTCLKQSDGECYSDDTVRRWNESQQQEEQGLLTYQYQDNLSQPVHEQTLPLVEGVQSKTESTLIEHCGSSKMETGRKGAKREGQPLEVERKRDDVETEPMKVKQCQRGRKSTGVTSTKTYCLPSTSSKAYVSTSVNNKDESVTKTTLSLQTRAGSSSMHGDRLEEGTSKKQQMQRSSNALSKSRVSTSDKNKPCFTPISHNLDDSDMDSDSDDANVVVDSSEEDSELENIEALITSYLDQKKKKGKKAPSKGCKKLMNLLKVNTERYEMKLGKSTMRAKAKQEKGKEMPTPKNVMTDEDNNSD